MCMVYLDTPVCEWHWNQLGLDRSVSVAVFHIPYPFDFVFQSKINWALDNYNSIIILCSELHRDSVNFIQQYQHSNIHYFVCGVIPNVKTYTWMDWFSTTASIYQHNNLLDQLTPYRVKPKSFDALLGWAKPHRQVIFDRLQNNKNVVLSYLQNRSQSLQQSGWISAEDCIVGGEVRNTITRVNYHNQEASISQIIPFSVYNQTAYTIVAETNYDNDYSFYTEKIVKPILASRLFVVFSGQHYLKNLTSLGFKTFNNIIDESYDSVEDNTVRFTKALEQVEYLIAQPQQSILEKIKPIVEHNKKLMLETNWMYQTHHTIKNII